MTIYRQILEALDPDLANVDKAELADWAAENYQYIRLALEMADAVQTS